MHLETKNVHTVECPLCPHSGLLPCKSRPVDEEIGFGELALDLPYVARGAFGAVKDCAARTNC